MRLYRNHFAISGHESKAYLSENNANNEMKFAKYFEGLWHEIEFTSEEEMLEILTEYYVKDFYVHLDNVVINRGNRILEHFATIDRD